MYDAWKKKVMQDTTKNYYIDTWFLSQNLQYYRPETLTSFISQYKAVQIQILDAPSTLL